jgi:hypothetical protein
METFRWTLLAGRAFIQTSQLQQEMSLMNSRHQAPRSTVTASTLIARIAQLPHLPMMEIKHLWRELFDNEAPTHNRQFLERRIAHRMQELECMKTTPEVLTRNASRIQDLLNNDGRRQYTPKPIHRPLAGTVLIREHEGVEHRVTVTHDGMFEYRGQKYRSLSKIASVITGTRWSGPLFFGLRKSKPSTRGEK